MDELFEGSRVNGIVLVYVFWGEGGWRGCQESWRSDLG